MGKGNGSGGVALPATATSPAIAASPAVDPFVKLGAAQFEVAFGEGAIGVQVVSFSNGAPAFHRVCNVIPDLQAASNGVLVDDLIVSVNGVSTADRNLEEMIEFLTDQARPLYVVFQREDNDQVDAALEEKHLTVSKAGDLGMTTELNSKGKIQVTSVATNDVLLDENAPGLASLAGVKVGDIVVGISGRPVGDCMLDTQETQDLSALIAAMVSIITHAVQSSLTHLFYRAIH
jgi:C-terminal processing protease CtpA/Prc